MEHLPPEVVVTGANGFVGRATVSALQRAGVPVRAVPAPRLLCPSTERPERYLPVLLRRHRAEVQELVGRLEGAGVLVHAAGRATPGSPPTAEMTGANSLLPSLMAFAAAQASVRRMVHLSTASVQGTCDPLDESPSTRPLTAYAESKALGETLLRHAGHAPDETIIFRPTSVQGGGRATSASLCRLVRRRWAPVFGGGDAPLPLALVENVAAAVVALVESPRHAPIVLYPSEGMTMRRLIEAVGLARPVAVPVPVGNALVGAFLATGRRVAPAAAIGRRLELMVHGQRQDARFLPSLGFRPPVGHDGYRRVCRGEG